jgi:hypothetical protein
MLYHKGRFKKTKLNSDSQQFYQQKRASSTVPACTDIDGVIFEPNLTSFHPVVLYNIFNNFQFVNQSEAKAVTLDVGKGQKTLFWKRNI